MSFKSLLPFSTAHKDVARTELSPFVSLQREIDRVFADFMGGWPMSDARGLTPRIDITERENQIEITAELPGLEEKDVEITVSNDVLTIRGEKKTETEQKDQTRHVVERSYGSFSRSVEVPEGTRAEDINAEMAKGVLKVTFPKPTQPKLESKKIAIKTAA